MSEKNNSGQMENFGMDQIPKEERKHWISPAIIYAGCMICIPVIYVGAFLTNWYTFPQAIWAIIIASGIVLVYDWINSSLGYSIGRPSSVIARCAFGRVTSRILISGLLVYMCLGWYGLHVSVSANAALALFGIDYTAMASPWPLWIAMVILGIFFATPAIVGFKLIAWINRIGLPSILVIGLVGMIMSVNHYGGWSNIINNVPSTPMPLSVGITTMVGVAAAQFVMISDYTRYCRKSLPDTLLVPLVGVIPAGIYLYLMGAIMSAGTSSADIVHIMSSVLGIPFWAFIFLILAQWTTEVVSAYSAGLSMTNMFNLNGDKRGLLTFIGALIGTLAAILGILDVMEGFLYTLAVTYPIVGTIMAVDFYLLRREKWRDIPGVNWTALIVFAIATFIGIKFPVGYVTLNVIIISGVLYYILMTIQAKIAPNDFTPEVMKDSYYKANLKDPFLLFGLIGGLIAALTPIITSSSLGDIGAVVGTGVVGIGFLLKLKQTEKQTT